MSKTKSKEYNIYWANLCILHRMEKERMDAALQAWHTDEKPEIKMNYLGNTDEIHIYDQVDKDLESGKTNFDAIVSNRFDLFCFTKYLNTYKDELYPMADKFPIRKEVKECGVIDPFGLLFPLVVLPHLIVCNMGLVDTKDVPCSLEELLEPKWSGKIFIGSTSLASARSILFAMWYKFGNKGLETCVKNWRQKNAPSAVRHSLIKKELLIGILPSIFTGAGPQDVLTAVYPVEGAPIVPSYLAVKKSEHIDYLIDFLSKSVLSNDLVSFYRDNAHAFPANPEVKIPEIYPSNINMFFPDWEWALKQDIEYFYDACSRVPFE